MFHPDRSHLVRAALRAPDRGPGPGLARDRPGRRRAADRAHRLGQDPGRLPLLPGLAGPPGHRRHARRIRPRSSTSRRSRRCRNDVQRNLEEPLAEIVGRRPRGRPPRPAPPRRRCAPATPPLAERRAAVRAAAPHPGHHAGVAVHPAHLRVGAPRACASVRTVIVDEIHALVGRQARRAPGAVARAARPPGRNAGVGCSGSACRPPCARWRWPAGCWWVTARRPPLVDASSARELDLGVEVLEDELGAVCTNEQWGEIYDRIAELARKHRSTIVFVNTRRLVERVALHLGERLGVEAVAAHHGSLSRARRFDAEQRLKSGQLKAMVATASLELGIDVGAVDLVVLIGSPRSIATGVQRVGRSGHAVGGTPKGRFFPLTRDQLCECAALVRGRAPGRARPDRACGTRRSTSWPSRSWPCAPARSGTRTPSTRWCGGPAPYAELARDRFDAVVDMLSEGIATSRGRRGRPPPPRRASTGGCAGGGARAWPPSPRAAPSPTPATTRWWSSPRARWSAPSTRTSPSRAWRATSSCWATPPGASAGWRTAGCGSRTPPARRPPSRSGWARRPAARASCRSRWAPLREEIVERAGQRGSGRGPRLAAGRPARSTPPAPPWCATTCWPGGRRWGRCPRRPG